MTMLVGHPISMSGVPLASGLIPQYPRKSDAGMDSISQNPNPYFV